MNIDNDKIIVFIDQKDTNTLIKKNFRNYIESDFRRKNKKINFVQIQSHNENGLLVVDFVAWAIHRKYNLNDDSYYQIISNKIKSERELWKP
jgi:hypothetical protein